MKVAILILAAGQSSRMGRPKQLLTVDGKTLIERSIDTALASDSKAVYCVLGAHATTIRPLLTSFPVRIIENPNYKDGLSTSIVAGIEELEKDQMKAALVLLADQPKITVNHLNNLISLFMENPGQIAATAYQNTLGVPALFPNQYFAELKALTGDKGARVLLNEQADCIKAVPFADLTDIDTPEDYQQLLKNK